MKNIIPILFLIMFFGCKKPAEQYSNLHLKEVQHFQDKMNNSFAKRSSSPLKPEDLANFKSLDFYDADEKFKVEAILELTPNDAVFEMVTTTDRKPLYKRFGIATFSLNGKEYQLNVYQNQELLLDFENRNYLFLPFTDETNGKETYKGGRYLDLEIPTDNKLTIDFNKAYNPLCVYNVTYSCPIVPKENHINTAIKAGVKDFKSIEK